MHELHVYLNPESREGTLLDSYFGTGHRMETSRPKPVSDDGCWSALVRSFSFPFRLAFPFFPWWPDRWDLVAKARHMSNRMRTQELAHTIHVFGGF